MSSVDGCILRVWLHFSLEVPDVPQLPGMRKMTKEDVPRVHNLVSNYLRWFTHWGKTLETWEPGVFSVCFTLGGWFFSRQKTLEPFGEIWRDLALDVCILYHFPYEFWYDGIFNFLVEADIKIAAPFKESWYIVLLKFKATSSEKELP